eukprot:8067_1
MILTAKGRMNLYATNVELSITRRKNIDGTWIIGTGSGVLTTGVENANRSRQKKGWKRHINYVPHRNTYYCAECLTTFTTKEEFDAHPKHTFAAKPAKATKRNRKPSVQTKVDMAASPRIEFTGHPNYQQIIYFDHSGNQRVKLADLGTGRHGSYLKRTRTSSDLANHNTLP